MKTNYLSCLKNFRYLYLCIVVISITSCSSFKNSSYYDSDGIYSSSDRETSIDNNQTYTQTKPNSVYVDKFRQIQNDFEETEYFTDVDSYTSNRTDTVYVIDKSYAGWGNNSSDVNINYYNNGWNNWGYGFNSWYGPGWNNGFYFGNPWGFGFNYGWNNWLSPYPYYWWNGWYPNNYYRSPGRRGMNGYYPSNFGRNSRRTATISRGSTRIGNSTIRSNTRNNSSNTNPRSTASPRSNSNPRNSTTSPRNTNTPRSTTPTRSFSSPRSSSPSSGGFGGGRSSGGGGRGGRG